MEQPEYEGDYSPDQQYVEDDYDYQEDDMAVAVKATRVNKKKAADDARLLANRIALLKMEEKKAWKKIQETKRKAEQVMQVRQRNDEDRVRKEQLKKQRDDEEAARHAQNQAARAANNKAIN